ncbi:hypothetical protein COW99_05585 [Candidatus Roizmanbacteria bacterium CG22_combo_CG10-13_8_21_14_all_38_20]|uniref:Phosphoribosyltransferase domain-containing protein n=1 Tax=Candidatus Roizmanbacteria bacterium CG22_combo_CG10-13_8_21_14_all_38_20 TaxID=1974862 RepID=A0A2H0BUA9_9BACT|nr:ComF family protein [Candidatus Microgenomates bacterium]PIP61252.1 MAG: hypothetical protein COW99_05585 [Candidatus Roizmanbacteria bacterium CG22_combo_CG10-13_8_21_14_all_38_20]PJC31243.1 MAG: hypothetical protein CO050_04245 [Candidatus Roizmanbacteria bacterium CG_4_9_14_0_2_um_filter_38_17]
MANPLLVFLKLLSPKRCVSCRKFGAYFCVNCLKSIKPVFHQKCIACQRVSHGGATHRDCNKRYGLDGLFCLFKYQTTIRAGITKLKYQKLTDIEDELVDLIGTNLLLQGEAESLDDLEEFIFSKRPIVVPVPLHWWKLAQRGFNQAEIISEVVASEYDLPVMPRVLRRKFRSSSQTKLTSKQRVINAKNIYSVNTDYLEQGKIDPALCNILLVDDVTTTGSTLKEAAIALKRVGVKRVWGIALAS